MKIYYLLFCVFLYSSLAHSQVIFLDSTATGNNSGINWENAFTDLHDALELAQYGDEIWIAKGTYFTTKTDDRSIFFNVKKGVSLYGGFDGTEILKGERDLENNATFLSGNLGDLDDPNDNSFTILYLENPDTANIIDGLRIESSDASRGEHLQGISDLAKEKSGGGIYIDATNQISHPYPTIKNCFFSNNRANKKGGAIFINGSLGFDVSARIEDCQFPMQNYADYGASIYFIGGSSGNDIIIKDCFFSQNSIGSTGDIGHQGGNIRIDISHGNQEIKIENCIFEENWIYSTGLMAVVQVPVKITMKNCLFENNLPIYNGGIIKIAGEEDGTVFNLENSDFLFNKHFLPLDTSLILLQNIGEANILNCNFQGNQTQSIEALIELRSTDANIVNCAFVNNHGSVIEMESSLDNYTDVVNCLFYNNQAVSTGKSGVLSDPTPLGDSAFIRFQNCILWENSHSATGKLIDFPYGHALFENCLVDVADCSEINETGVDCNSEMVFNQDPLFLDPQNEEFALLFCSPAINSGDNTAISPYALMTDLSGGPRILDSLIDMGPYEWHVLEIFAEVDEVQATSCFGGEDGSVTFQIENGCPLYTYEWQTATTTGTGNTNLAAGDYSFTITDGANNLTVQDVVISEPPALEIDVMATIVDCGGTIGATATSLVEGGTAPYLFDWSNGQTDSILTNLAAGNYDLTITDAHGCTQTKALDVEKSGNLSLSITATPISCHDTQDGTLAVAPQNGVFPYVYDWSSGHIDSILTGLGGGNYSLTVSDNLGCTDELSVELTPPDTLNGQVLGIDVLCKDDNNGVAIASAIGGTSPYSYHWDNLLVGDTLNDLSPGTYVLTITDQNGCEDSKEVIIGEPDLLTFDLELVDVTCYDDSDGMAAVIPDGGTDPYSYSWGDSVITDIPGGTYPILVTDANGCTVLGDAFILEPLQIGIEVDTIHASTPDSEDGMILVNSVFGGTAPFAFLWSTGDSTTSIDNLAPGGYFLTITDSLGCEEVFEFEVSFMSSTIGNFESDWDIQIFPNPSNGKVFLKFERAYVKGLKISILDRVGRIVFEQSFLNQEVPIELDLNLNSGIYFIQVEGEELYFREKLVIVDD